VFRGPQQMSNEKNEGSEHLRETAERIRQLARETWIPEIAEELSDLADLLDRMAEISENSGEVS
jgi:hypothetical protein